MNMLTYVRVKMWPKSIYYSKKNTLLLIFGVTRICSKMVTPFFTIFKPKRSSHTELQAMHIITATYDSPAPCQHEVNESYAIFLQRVFTLKIDNHPAVVVKT